MSNKGKSGISDLIDFLMILGAGGWLAFITFMLSLAPSISSPLPFLFTLLAWALGTIGTYRFLGRREKKLRQQIIEDLKTIQGSNGSSYDNNQGYLSPKNPFNPQAALPNGFNDSLEVRILDFMAMKKGRITLIEAIVYLREPIDKIKPVLEKLQAQGLIHVDIAEGGEMIYVAEGFSVK